MSSALILMAKLYDEKRYNDAIKVFYKFVETNDVKNISTVPQDLIKVAANSLLAKVNKL